MITALLMLVQSASGLEATMLDNDKLLVVLAVVLLIWAGIVWFIHSTDRKIGRLEHRIQALESGHPTI